MGNGGTTPRKAKPNRRWCKGKKADGSPCKAYPLKGEPWCLLHHPEKKTILLERSITSREEQAAKDKQRQHFWENLVTEVETTADVKQMLLRAISEVHEGTLLTQQASSISSLSGHLIKTIELDAVDDRVKFIKQKLRDSGMTEEQIRAKLSGQSKTG